MEILFFILACFMFLGNITDKNQKLRDEALQKEKLDTLIDGMYNEYRNN